MTKETAARSAAETPGAAAREPESLDQLRGDCASMADRWPAPAERTERGSGDGASAGPTRGVRVPDRAGRLVEGMSDYGD